MAERRIRTVLDVDAGPAIAGFRRGQAAVTGFGSAVRRQNATLASAAGASRTAANSITGLNTAAAATSGSMRGLSSGMAASAAGATALSGGVKSGANSMAGLQSATVGAKAGLSTFGQAAVTSTSLASGGMKQAASAAAGFKARTTAALSGVTSSISQNQQEWAQLSTGAVVAGAAIVGSLALMGKAAIDWESNFAGVKKTVDDSAEGYAKLETELRGLATTLPATHAEIAGVAEAAGQLGIERDNVTEFTKTMIDMGESTNLSAEEAATGMARFANVMGTSQDEFDNIGSSMVELGNNFATTEGEILAMAQRLSGASRQANMTEGDVLGMATALSSLGIKAESGGTAFSKVILEMGKSVDTGSEKLETFARVAGMSGEEFQKLWGENSGEAMQQFIAGLGDMQDRGESLEPVLSELGFTGIRVGDVLRRSASGQDLFTEAMQTGNSAYKAATALSEEAAQRYETDAARIEVAWNKIKDAAISFGATIAPVMTGAAEAVGGLATAFEKIPGPVKSVLTAFAGITGGALLIGGVTVKAISGAQGLATAFQTLGVNGGLAAGGLDKANVSAKGLARWGGYALGATAVVLALGKIAEAARPAPATIDEVTEALRDLDDTASSMEGIDDIFAGLDDQSGLQRSIMDTSIGVESLADAFRKLDNPSAYDSTMNFISGLQSVIPGMESDVGRLESQFSTFGESLAEMPADEAAAKFQILVDSLGGGEDVAKRLLELMPAYADSLTDTGNASSDAADGAQEFDDGLADVRATAEDAQAAVDGLSDAITGLGSTFLDERQAARDYEEALDAMASSIAENGNAWDINTEAGRANQEALEGVATAARDSAAAIVENGGSVEDAQAVLEQGRKDVEAFGRQMGLSKSEVKLLTDQILQLPPEATVEFELQAEEAQRKADAFKAKVDLVDGSRGRAILTQKGAEMAAASTQGFYDALMQVDGTHAVAVQTEKGAALAKKSTQGFYDSLMTVGRTNVTAQVNEKGAAPSKGRVDDLDGSIRDLDGKTVDVNEKGATPSEKRVRSFDRSIIGTHGKTVDVNERGSTPSEGRVRGLDRSIRGLDGKSVDVRANVSGQSYVDNLRWAIAGLRDKSITIRTYHQTLYRNNAPGRSPGPWSNADGGMYSNSGAGLHQYMADGGTIGSFAGQQPHIRRAGGAGVTWAEDGAGPWESWISGHPAKAARSKSIWLETGKRLGMIQAMADGGTRHMSPHAGRTYVPPTQAAPRVNVQSPSMSGMEITGTLDTPWGPAQVRGIVKDELTSQARQARIQGAR